jgi:hypothetical protein
MKLLKNLNIKKIFPPRILRKKRLFIFIILLVFTISINLFSLYPLNYFKNDIRSNNYKNKDLKLSGFIWARLDLTNPEEINETRFSHYQIIPIKGRLYNEYTGENKSGNLVVIVVNDIQYPIYNDTTDEGLFQINYTVNPSLNVNINHTIEVLVVAGVPLNGEIDYFHHYVISVNATSFFDITITRPAIPGENYDIVNGILKYDNQYGMGIPNKQINSSWYNVSYKIGDNPFFYTSADGYFSPILTIPNDNYSEFLYLNLSYFGNSPYINSSQTRLTINLYRNITCIWNIVSTASEGSQITISGQVLSNDTFLIINNRAVDIYYNGTPITTVSTDQNGFFQFIYQVPSGTGNMPIDVEIANNIGLNLRSNTTHYITITAAIPSSTSSPSGKGGSTDPPFFNFFLVFIPIIIGIVVGFSIYAYFYLKKQEEESKTIKVPLEGRIRNLKILKDTGRLEEALSYLFQSIYLELIQAKYNRVKKSTETIRDFAIISVKDLNLNPANIYPFIQNVEKIIYDKPFIINEADFYTAVDLFSPIYFELTGFNFILNF